RILPRTEDLLLLLHSSSSSSSSYSYSPASLEDANQRQEDRGSHPPPTSDVITAPPFLSFPSLTPSSSSSPPPPPAGALSSSSKTRTPGGSSSSSAQSSRGGGHGLFSDDDEDEEDEEYENSAVVELWILLSRHVRERQRDLSSKYLAVHLHATNERVACPPPPAKQGVYSNGECTLVKLRVHPKVFKNLLPSKTGRNEAKPQDKQERNGGGKEEEANGIRRHSKQKDSGGKGQRSSSSHLLDATDYVLVVSQYSQKDEFNFTIKVYGHIQLNLTQLPPLLPPDTQSVYFKGNWGPSTSGGCSNDLWRYFTNPHIRLKVPQPCEAFFFLESPQEHSVNLRLFKHRVATARILRTGKALSTGPYRAGCCVLKTFLEATTYTIIPSTFRPDDMDQFQLCIHVPGASLQKPLVPILLPHPYAIPPPPSFFYRIIDGSKSLLHLWSRVAMQVHGPTLVALRLELLSPPEPGDTYPSLTVYRYGEVPHEQPSSSCRDRNRRDAGEGGDGRSGGGGKGQASRHGSGGNRKLQLVLRSDLDGGLSEDGHTSSSAAQDLFQRQGVVNVTLVELGDPFSPYVVFISTVNNNGNSNLTQPNHKGRGHSSSSTTTTGAVDQQSQQHNEGGFSSSSAGG
ncbi:calpain family cysteine protease domain-containing protein, partial [Cystoisospora suis]